MNPIGLRIPLLLLGLVACSSENGTNEATKVPPIPAAGPPPAEPVSSAAPLTKIAPPVSLLGVADAIREWPHLVPGVHARSLTSFDRSGGNDDGFAGTYSELYVDENGRHVIFDESGPGVLRTLWFTSAVDGKSPLGLGPISFQFDDEPTPRLVVDADELFAGGGAPFVRPLVANNLSSTGGFASFAPLPFAKRLRVSLANRPGFMQVHYDLLPPDWDVASYVPASIDGASSTLFDSLGAVSAVQPLGPEGRTGSGVVDVLRFVPDADATDVSVQDARIAITVDGRKTVDMPLALFFGSARGVASVKSVAWTIEPRRFESRFPIPYASSMVVAVTGIAGSLFAQSNPTRFPTAETGTFEVITSDGMTIAGRDHTYVDVPGAGKLVGTVLGVDPLQASNKGWWEGDLRTALDDSRSPAIHGTGHEDDHLGGWSNELLLGPFSLPMQGAPRTDVTDSNPAVQINGMTTLYRLWPGIPFSRRIRHTTEHGPSNGRTARYTSAAFLYRQETPRLVKTGEAWLDGVGQSEPLSSAFEGEDATEATATVHSFTDASFTVSIDPNNAGVELRRWFDRAETPSVANLEVEGTLVRTIRTVAPWSPNRRWAEEDMFVPAQLTRGKSTLAVRWVATHATAVRFEAWTVKSP